MANNLDIPDDPNLSKNRTSLIQTRSPFLSSVVQSKVSLNPISKRESRVLSSAVKDARDHISRERQTLRSKSQISFTFTTETTPVMATSPEFSKRKHTFNAFLKSRDIELMLGEKNRIQNSLALEKNISSDQIQEHLPPPQIDIKQTLKRKEGKMFTNELWSAGYYKSVLHSSKLKSRHRHTASLLIKPSPPKVIESESPCNNTMQSPKPKNHNYLLNLTPCYESNQSIRDISQLREPGSGQLSIDASPLAHYHGQSALKSILRNLTPRKEKVQRNESSPYNGMSYKDVLITETSPNFMLSELNKGFKLNKPNQQSHNLHISFEKRCEEEGNLTLDGLSPINVIKPRKGLLGKYLVGMSSKFNGAKSPCGSKSSLKNSRRDRSEDSEFLEAPSTRRPEPIQLSNSKSLHTSTEHIETRQKVQLLINQCIDLGEENKNLEKEVMNTKADLEAFTNRRQLMKMKLKKKTELSEALQRQTNFLKAVHSQQRQKQVA